MKTVFLKAKELIERGQGFVFCTIISKSGSTPSGVGARMLVTADEIIGTIGGGGVEGDVICTAREKLLVNCGYSIKMYNLEAKEAAVSDFICGGSCEVLSLYIDAKDEHSYELFSEAYRAIEDNERAWLVYTIINNNAAEKPVQIALSVEGRGLFGTFTGNDKVSRDMVSNPIRIAIHGDTSEEIRYVVDQLHIGGLIYLFGGGHVSKEVARLAVGLEFRVVVIEDRDEFLTEERFPGCELMHIDSFDELPELKVDASTYIMIITRGHLHDKEVLRWALQREPHYLGMIGSRTKRDKLYETLIAEGSDENKIKTVHCPIGLSIGAKTPAEIAISIMAEVIACGK